MLPSFQNTWSMDGHAPWIDMNMDLPNISRSFDPSIRELRILLLTCHTYVVLVLTISSFTSRIWTRALLDVRHWLSRRRQLLLDGERSSSNIRELERRGAQQLQIRERGRRELFRTLEQRWQRPEVERLPLLFRDVFHLRSTVRLIEGNLLNHKFFSVIHFASLLNVLYGSKMY